MSKQKTELQRARDGQLAEWLRLGLAKSGVEKQALARELGLHPSAISHMLRGVREFKEAEVAIISKLIGETPPAFSDTSPVSGTRVEMVQSVNWAHPSVIIAANVWREAGAVVQLPDRIPLSPDPRLAGVDQYVCKIEGAPRYAVCVNFGEFRSAPRPGDMVHVVRANGTLEEHTLRRVTKLLDGTPYTVPLDPSGPESALEAAQTVRGLVVGFYAPEPVDI